MSAPIVARLPPKRMFFASLTSQSVTRSPQISLALSRLTTTVVSVFAAPRQPTPLAATAHGTFARYSLPGPQTIWLLLKVIVALRATPGNDWKIVATNTSTQGMVYEAVPLTRVWNGVLLTQPSRYSAPTRPLTLGASGDAKHVSRL